MQDDTTQSGRLSDADAEKILADKDNINAAQNVMEQNATAHEKMVAEMVNRAQGGIGTVQPAQQTSAVHGVNDINWKNMPVENMPTGGFFYPVGTEVTFRSADVSEIRQWSTIDEGDMLDMDVKMNLIIERCVRMKGPDGAWMSWEDLVEIDRFFMLFAVHEITFPNGENKLNVKFKCPPTCAGDGTYRESVQLRSDMLNLLVFPPELMQYYNPDERCFTKVSQKLGETLRFYLPTIGVAKKIKNVVAEARQNGDYIDEAFMRLAPYMFKDWRNLNAQKLESMRMESFKWGRDKLLFMNGMIDMIKGAVNLSVKKECPKCHVTLEAPIFFRGGFTIKNLFAVSDKFDDLI